MIRTQPLYNLKIFLLYSPDYYALIHIIHTFNASAWQGRLSSFKSFSLNGNDKELLRNATENTSKTWRSFCIAVTIFAFCFLFTDWVISRVFITSTFFITTVFQSNIYRLCLQHDDLQNFLLIEVIDQHQFMTTFSTNVHSCLQGDPSELWKCFVSLVYLGTRQLNFVKIVIKRLSW